VTGQCSDSGGNSGSDRGSGNGRDGGLHFHGREHVNAVASRCSRAQNAVAPGNGIACGAVDLLRMRAAGRERDGGDRQQSDDDAIRELAMHEWEDPLRDEEVIGCCVRQACRAESSRRSEQCRRA
jgi:hypothetical protein